MRTVGAQLELQALCIPYVDHQLFENPHFTVRMNGYQQTALDHQLQQPDRFHGHRLAARIGAGNDQQPVFIVQRNIRRNRGLLIFPVVEV